MLKAVIDTSVFISGLIKNPNCRKIIKTLEEEKFILIISSPIIEELMGVISRPKFHNVIDRDTAARLIETIKNQALLIRPSFSLKVVKDDIDDNRFLEAALAAKADCIVSLDNHLLKLRAFRHIPVITPAKFLILLDKSLAR